MANVKYSSAPNHLSQASAAKPSWERVPRMATIIDAAASNASMHKTLLPRGLATPS